MTRFLVAILLAAGLLVGNASAQDYPTRPITTATCGMPSEDSVA